MPRWRQQIQLICEICCPRAIWQMQLLQHGGHVSLYRIQRARQFLGNLEIALTGGNEQKHLALPWAQAVYVGVGLIRALRFRELAHERFRDRILE